MNPGTVWQSRARWSWALLAIVFLGTLIPWSGALARDRWLLIDTGELTLSVMEGERAVRSYTNISIGRDGTTGSKTVRDDRTPLGTFRISGIRAETRFHRFFSINYPALDDAERAFQAGRLDSAGLAVIRRAHERGEEPPSSTPLGGNIGIHGIGEGDPRVHEDFNWTDGCIALTNEQIDDLAQWVRMGMTVVIR